MICIDSDAIIDYLKGRKGATDLVKTYAGEIVTTEINVFEVYYGIYLKKNSSNKEETIANAFFNSIKVLPFDKPCGKIASKILTGLFHIGKPIDQNDCLIASIILRHGYDQIITGNKKHFSRIKDLKVISYS
ncbi:MAG: type II toxin-antitoxin system VapC family toxin [Nanoarchaeota archaeon]|nr:type II toxin-antitoxin system VapC family toxin [Nanoarchaeota archaeon]MBU0978124.1 type II toxin-antitoxin system VapC family toxin [Nanoarchaeota archaeon]